MPKTSDAVLRTGTREQQRVLVVDDDAAVARLIADMMRRLNYQADIAQDAMEALEMFKTENYPLVITDLMMPQSGGDELADRIKELSVTVRVIIMTGCSRENVASLREHCRADDWLFKPFSLNRLRATLAGLPSPIGRS